MGAKNQVPVTFNWQATSPVSTFLPQVLQSGSIPSGVIAGSVSGSQTIYSQILDLKLMDMVGIEFNWTGTPAGAFTIYGSVSGANFYTFTGWTPALTNPIGTPGGFLAAMLWFPFRYMYMQYTNVSGNGALTAFAQLKDWN